MFKGGFLTDEKPDFTTLLKSNSLDKRSDEKLGELKLLLFITIPF